MGAGGARVLEEIRGKVAQSNRELTFPGLIATCRFCVQRAKMALSLLPSTTFASFCRV